MITLAVRRKAFRAALAIAGLSLVQWCKQHNIGHHHAGLVLNGKRGSRLLVAEMNAFINRTLFPFVEDYRREWKREAA